MSQSFTQDNRPIAISTPLGKDALLLEMITGQEALSQPYRFSLVVLAQPDQVEKIQFEKLLGQTVCATIKEENKPIRHFHGHVTAISQGAEIKAADVGQTFVRFSLQIVPEFDLLRHTLDSRIFQQKSVPDILKSVLSGINVKYELQKTYQPRDYCVQYRESTFHFASRLMEEEGIFYYFLHNDASHTMVVAESNNTFQDLPDQAQIKYWDFLGLGDRWMHEDRISRWEKTQQMRSGKTTLRDYSFEMPDKTLEYSKPVPAALGVGQVTHKLAVGSNDKLERYDMPGDYAKRYDGVAPGGGDRAADVGQIEPTGEATTLLRMQEITAGAVFISGEGNVRRLLPGRQFTLKEHYNGDGTYAVVQVQHQASLKGSYTTLDKVNLQYSNRFLCIPKGLNYRPPRVTPRPQVPGLHTALVVGEPGAEISVDKYGRVKVQFRFDRQGKKNLDSSCWIRVAQPLSGQQWGGIFLPRVGHEVLVAFEEGDPDQPIIVGSVYNANNMPPYTLPDNKTISTIKTRSSLKGNEQNFNELRFNDLKDQEEIYFHAEKDFLRVVENNDTLKVGFDKKNKGDQLIEIYNNRTERVQEGHEVVTIEKGNRTITVKKGNDLHQVETGNRSVIVDQGDDSHEVKMGNRSAVITQGNDSFEIKSGSSTTEAMQKIELKVGPSSIVLTPEGITIKSPMIKIESSGTMETSGLVNQVKGSQSVVVQGGMVKIN